MKRMIPLIAALAFTVALPAAAQVGGAIAPTNPAAPGLPTPMTPGTDSTKPMPLPQGNGTDNRTQPSSSNDKGRLNGSAGGTVGGGTVDGGGAGVGGAVQGDGNLNRGGSLNGLDNDKTRGMNGSLPDGTGAGSNRNGNNVDGNATTTGSGRASKGRIDINTSSEMSMQSDLGLTAAQAKAVREYRDANGPLTSESQLRSIKGIGPRTRARMKDRLNFDDGSTGSTTR